MKNNKCKICDDYLDSGFQTGLSGEKICQECYETEVDGVSTVIHFYPNGVKEVAKFSEHFSFNKDWDLLNALPEPIKVQKWVKIDDWRGHIDWEYQDGFKEVASGWVTQMPDETTSRKLYLNALFSDLQDGTIVPPVDIYWIFGRTSNVFSTASAIVARNGDEQALDNWLDGGIASLKDKFS